MKPAIPLLAVLLVAGASGARADCPAYVHGGVGGDYNNPDDRQGLAVVEKFHFTPAVEKLQHGLSGTLGGDIGYTLEHFPNHPAALAAMARLSLRDKTPRPDGAKYTLACFFERALGYQPRDAKVRVIYGAYLLAKNELDGALRQWQEASRLEPDNVTTLYNLGLLYVKKKDYAQARLYAGQAYERGFPLPGLKNKLIAAGQWDQARDQAKPAAPQAVPLRAPEGAAAAE